MFNEIAGLVFAVEITLASIFDLGLPPPSSVFSSVVVIFTGLLLASQYVYYRDVLRLPLFYADESRAAAAAQHRAGVAVVILLSVNFVAGLWSIGIEASLSLEPAEVLGVAGYRILTAAYYAVLFFYLPACQNESAFQIFVVTVAGAAIELGALTVAVTEYDAGSPIFPLWFVLLQAAVTAWAVLYDYIIYQGVFGCCRAHRGRHRLCDRDYQRLSEL